LKRSITQTIPHDSPGDSSFLVPKISEKNEVNPNGGAKCTCGRLNRRTVESDVNVVQSQVYDTERPPLFAVCLREDFIMNILGRVMQRPVVHPSVCLSHAGIASKWLHASAQLTPHGSQEILVFFSPETLTKFECDLPLWEHQRRGGDFRPVCRNISESVQIHLL